jgi:hypothetical protein
VPTHLHLVTRDDDQRRADDPADGWDDDALASEFPPGWDDYAAARQRFVTRVVKRRANPVERELLEDGDDRSWL